MATGTLSIVKVKGEKKLQIAFNTSKKQYVQCLVNDEQISLALLEKKQRSIDSLRNLDVEFEEEDGKPIKIRELGTAWERLDPEIAMILEAETRAIANIVAQRNSEKSDIPEGEFRNPYNFIPALSRDAAGKGELGDRNPLKYGMGHSVYQSDRWSGRIAVKMTTKTPLLIPDICDEVELPKDENGIEIRVKDDKGNLKGHKTYPLRIGADGMPYLPPTSVKGMLRSAYEAVTNSRLSVFEKHSDRLFYRMSAGDGLSLVPARIEGDRIRLMSGTTTGIPTWNDRNQRWVLPDNLMYAAWLPRYRRDRSHNVGYAGMQHGDRVRVWLEMWKKEGNNGNVIFKYWLVKQIVPYTGRLGARPEVSRSFRNHEPVSGEPMISADGYVCITNRNIENKHDERVFFYRENPPQHIEPVAEHQSDWKYLIADYQKIHQGQDREDGLSWSRHVLAGANELSLSDKDLCYAYVNNKGGVLKIEKLYPVMISRAIYDLPPDVILHHSLKPADNMDKLSPADRVFGWVNQKGNGAYKGNLRIHSVQCHSPASIEPLGVNGLPLAILGQPKPQQARFYASRDDEGRQLEDSTEKKEGYGKEAKGLRGRKVYPHHHDRSLPAGYWDDPTTDRNQEYLSRGEKIRSEQNRSIRAWVKPGTEFTFEIDVTNLSDVELGGLLWLLELGENHFHRLGGGKPFGFGSVSLAIAWNETDLRTGIDWKAFYSSLDLVENSDRDKAKVAIAAFKKAIAKVYKGTFESVPFIEAFCQAATGYADTKPTHYPRLTSTPGAESKVFEWFVKNERTGRNPGLKRSLSPLAGDKGLPYDPTK